ncbi:MAG: DUF72 domain-containing protein [Halochromatium sp.]
MASHRIGTSGWSYDHWNGPFYPDDLPSERRLDAYARTFNGTEINNSFYQLPSEDSLVGWRDSVPDDFCFAVKASRYITHMKKLKDPAQGLTPLLERMSILGPKRGPLLFQLPPTWRFNPERLEQFLDALKEADDDAGRCAFEFRDQRWINDDSLALLERHHAAFCIYELDGYQTAPHLTADFVYLRLHGPNGPYRGSYSDQTLEQWAEALQGWADSGLDTYCWFDNDEAGYAPRNAQTLARLLEPK